MRLQDVIFGLGKQKPPAPRATESPTSPGTASLPIGEMSDEQVIAFVDALCGPQRTRAGHLEARPPSQVPQETIRSLAREWPDGPTEEEITTLREAQRRVDAANESVNLHSRDRVKEAHEGSRAAIGAALVDGKGAEHVEVKDRAGWELHFAERRAAGKLAARKACVESWPVAEGIVRRFIEFARGRCRELEVADFRQYQRLGIAYAPSALTLVLHDLVGGLEARIAKVRSSGIFPAPKHATFGIVEL